MRESWLLKAIGSVALWSFILWADPLGVETATDKSSLDLFQRVYSPHYRTSNQDKIYVVLIQDEDLPLRGDGPPSWPPDYEDYAALIDVLRGNHEYKPAGIFLDILFENVPAAGEGISNLCAQASVATSGGVPVIFARLPDFEADNAPLPSALRLCEEEIETAAVGWQADAGFYPFSVTADGTVHPTAAAALYNTANNQDVFDDLERTSNQFSVGGNRNELRTVWGAATPGTKADGCKKYRGGVVEKLGHSGQIFLNGLIPQRISRDAYEYVQPCTFHAIKSARDLLAMSVDEREYLSAELEGSVILVGVNVDGIPDFVDSPVHGLLPGVFMHAMALDNMLTLGPAYLRDAPQITLPAGGFGLGADIIVQTLLLLGLALMLAVSRGRAPSEADDVKSKFSLVRRWSAGLAFNLIIFTHFSLVVAAVVIITLSVMHWAPLNYGGLLLVAAAMIFSKNPSNSAPGR